MEEEEDSEIPDLEEEGEKENEELCNEGETPVSNPIKKCKRKKGQDTTSEEPNDKKNKTNEESSEQGTGAFNNGREKFRFSLSPIFTCGFYFYLIR